MKPPVMIRVGGLALIAGALAFMAVFAFLAARFNYPDVLDGAAETVLPQLLATGGSGRAAWALYAFLPLIWLPAGVGAYVALRRSHPGAMLLALQCAALAAISMMLGLMRWPSIHWRLAELYVSASPDQKAVLSSIFDGLNVYLGNYIGEFLGELSFSTFIFLSGWAALACSRGTAMDGDRGHGHRGRRLGWNVSQPHFGGGASSCRQQLPVASGNDLARHRVPALPAG